MSLRKSKITLMQTGNLVMILRFSKRHRGIGGKQRLEIFSRNIYYGELTHATKTVNDRLIQTISITYLMYQIES